MSSITKKRHLLVYGRYRLDYGSFLFFIRSIIEWSDNVIFEGVPSIPILVVLGNYRKHKITQFYTNGYSCLGQRMLIMFKTSFKYFKSNWICWRTINEETWHWYNDHVGQKKCPVVDTWWQTETGGIMIAQLHLLRQRNQLMRHYRYREFRQYWWMILVMR
jgi:hypothetical protein